MDGVGVIDDGFSLGDHGGHGHGDYGSNDIRRIKNCSGERIAGYCQNAVGVAHDDVGSHFGKL